MPPSLTGVRHLLMVECKNPACASFFATSFQLEPDAFVTLEERDDFQRCPRCGVIHRYAKSEHVFLLQDEAA